ncbi:cytochrome P450 [Suillus placidus]|uniref:Cytochrome P450 n=1 Tax=Suillus placidus TaxID=48579 RepID=A0A9P6ZHD7_9AGAM|nr:cytochrome P450 [Suillus placidus]
MISTVEGRLAILAIFPISVVVVTALGRYIKNRQTKPPLPPGPVPIPLLGNILSINTKEPWLTYTQWHAVYGDLVFARILDQDVVVINSQHVAQALLDKRSGIYSDRPFIATVEPCGWSIAFAFTGYNDEWRRCRRIFQQTFRPDSALKFRPMQMRRAREMIVNLIDDPQHYHSHFATFSSSVGMSAIYDYQPSARDDPLVQIMENALIIGVQMVTSERAALLKAFPFLLKLPDWCWGSSLRRDLRTSANRMREMTDVPFRYTQQHMADSSSLGQLSMVAENLRRMEKQDEASKPIRCPNNVVYHSTFLQTTSTLMVFALAMVSYPDVQRRAQAEINSVIGRDRLPAFEDRASLPYVESILRETLRWQPVGPLGVPHATSSDDIYDGYFIPKGATVIYNIWSHTMDEKRYPDASRFMPERFLDVNGALTDDDPAGYVFGSGRRGCPGRYTVDATLWSAIATMLATVEFSFAKDDQGKTIDFTPRFATGFNHTPVVFPCNISPRSHIHSELVDLL